MNRYRKNVLLMVSLVFSACGADTISCTAMNNGMPRICVEYSGFSGLSKPSAQASIKILCNTLQAEIRDEACNKTGALAACKKEESLWTQTTWSYPTASVKTQADVQCSTSEIKLTP